MPSMSSSDQVQVRLNRAIIGVGGAVDTMQVLAKNFKAPFLEAIVNTGQSLLTIIQVKSEVIPDLLPPHTLNHLAKATESLHKVHGFVEAHQEKNWIKGFFQQGEMNILLKDCKRGLQQTLDDFKFEEDSLFKEISKMQKYAQDRHQEVLQLIEELADDAHSEKLSINRTLFSSHNSSTSISMLPPEPKIFHGRESEVLDILNFFSQQIPRIVILGPGGMGKTSLAQAVLHHPQITDRFAEHRFFVACDSASTKVELAALIGDHLGLKPGGDLTGRIIHFFSSNPACLLILDNLETVWEPIETRADIEEFLSLITDVKHLALLITMRGAERPGKVNWTRPFLQTLKPLAQAAARQTFMDIADNIHDSAEIDQVLLLTDNLPLAIDLIAHLVDSEDCSTVLSRWGKEKTSLLSNGYDKQSNLDLSISVSLNSPRIRAAPHARDLLSLLSMLPDGILDVELIQSQLSIDNILSCKTILLATSLASHDEKKHLKVLAPIREYMQKFYPPTANVVQPLLEHFQSLLEFHNQYSKTSSHSGIQTRISSNFANIQNILQNSLHSENPQLVKSIYCTCYLEEFSLGSRRGHIPLLDHIPQVLPRPIDHKLEFYFISVLLTTWRTRSVSNGDLLIKQALEHLPYFDDSDTKCEFYHTVGDYFLDHDDDSTTAMQHYQTALSLSKSSQNTNKQSDILTGLAWLKWQEGNHLAGQMHAFEAQRLAKASGNYLREARALKAEAMCWIALGNYKHALHLCTRGRHLLSLWGLSGGAAEHGLLINQADIYRFKSEYVEAYNIWRQIFDESNFNQSPSDHAWALLMMVLIAIPMGMPRQVVQRHLDTAKLAYSAVGRTLAVIFCEAIIADLDLEEGKTQEASLSLEKCLKFSWGKDTEVQTYCLERLANGSCWCLTKWRGWTSSWATIYLVYSLKSKQRLDIHKSLQFLGDVLLAEGDQDTAVCLFTVALEGFTHMDIHCSRAECMLRLGEIAKLNGDHSTAGTLWTTAIPLFERASQSKQISHLHDKLTDISGNVGEHHQSLAHLSSLQAPVDVVAATEWFSSH